jgi:hypothetical protein
MSALHNQDNQEHSAMASSFAYDCKSHLRLDSAACENVHQE